MSISLPELVQSILDELTSLRVGNTRVGVSASCPVCINHAPAAPASV